MIARAGSRPGGGRRATRPAATLVVFALGSLLLLACSEIAAKEATVAPSKVESIPESSVSKVTFLESAAERIAVRTATVQEVSPGPRGEPGPLKVVPYSAVIYDLTGGTWVYTSPQPLTYVREPVSIDYVQLNLAVLSAGPEAGTTIVTVGVAEIYGAETGVR